MSLDLKHQHASKSPSGFPRQRQRQRQQSPRQRQQRRETVDCFPSLLFYRQKMHISTYESVIEQLFCRYALKHHD